MNGMVKNSGSKNISAVNIMKWKAIRVLCDLTALILLGGQRQP